MDDLNQRPRHETMKVFEMIVQVLKTLTGPTTQGRLSADQRLRDARNPCSGRKRTWSEGIEVRLQSWYQCWMKGNRRS